MGEVVGNKRAKSAQAAGYLHELSSDISIIVGVL